MYPEYENALEDLAHHFGASVHELVLTNGTRRGHPQSDGHLCRCRSDCADPEAFLRNVPLLRAIGRRTSA